MYGRAKEALEENRFKEQAHLRMVESLKNDLLLGRVSYTTVSTVPWPDDPSCECWKDVGLIEVRQGRFSSFPRTVLVN